MINTSESKHKKLISLIALLFAYFICRLFFQQLPYIKSTFIYPTGLLVDTFYSTGTYINSEWIFITNNTKFILGESCSGTTFFSLLLAYLVYTKIEHKTPSIWLLIAYPMTLIANSMRVLSSIYAHNVLSIFEAQKYGDYIHVMTGTVTFLTCLLLIAVLIGKTRNNFNNEKSRITT